MVTYLKDKIVDKTVNTAAIGNDKVLVYKTATSTFVFEAQSAVGAIDDLTDVTISGVPADNEVLAYDTGTSEFINQTAAEAGLATVAGLATKLNTTGGTVSGALALNGTTTMGSTLVMGGYDITGAATIHPTSTTITIPAILNLSTHKIENVVDPTAAQEAATKNYADTHLFTKEAVTSFTDGYVPVYRTASGKFEMEAGGASAGLPVVDTTSIVKGSADGTKLIRFEVDGLTSGTTRVLTVPDKSFTICGTDEVMLLSGTQAMAGNMDMGSHALKGITSLYGASDSSFTMLQAGPSTGDSPRITQYGANYPTLGGSIQFAATNAAGNDHVVAMYINGKTDTPVVEIYHGLDMNGKNVDDIGAVILNDATELTIGAGAITVTQKYHTIDTAGDDPTDDLVNIAGGTAGQEIIIRAIDSARTVVVKHGTGNIQLDAAADKTLDNTNDTLSMIFDGTNWLQTGFSNNGA